MPQSSILGQIIDRGMEILGFQKEKLDCLQLLSMGSDLSFFSR